ncbi:MAG: peptidase domain-containing ABC transporter [Bacteroidota bacterium]
MSKKFPFHEQLDSMDCGVACLRMVASYHGRTYEASRLRDMTFIDREGVSLLGISHAAEQIGLKSIAAPIPYQRLTQDIPLPAIAHWEDNHFIVVYQATDKQVWVGDPAKKRITKLSKADFLAGWSKPEFPDEESGILLLLEPMSDFMEKEGGPAPKNGIIHLLSYLKQYQPLVRQLYLGVLLVAIFQFIFPFFIRAIVDKGVMLEDTSFIIAVSIAFLVLFLSQTLIEFFRNKIIRLVGTKINAQLMSEFIAKLLQLPISYFESKVDGDILQRIYDNQRVEKLLTSTSFLAFFSIGNLIVSAFVLFVFSLKIFWLFLVGIVIYFLWAFQCLEKRKELEGKRFEVATRNQNALGQLVSGIHEIKQHNVELEKRWEWEAVQTEIYEVNNDYFSIEQRQKVGAAFINDFKNIAITIVAAHAIIDPSQVMSLGTLVAIQYLIGQLNGPMEQIITFLSEVQDAKLSVERMNELHREAPKEDLQNTLNVLPETGEITFEKVSFRYEGLNAPLVLRNINLTIPEGKTTAIVGSSGSGKTTLLKLLLGVYQPTEGTINLGNVNLAAINGRLWRSQYDVVSQDGQIFFDTITNNIAFGAPVPDKRKVIRAARIANIQRYIEKLVLGYSTIIGPDTVSGGQKQRLLIARAAYTNPNYLFLDEPTNPLDTYNEMIIMENLADYFVDKTVVIVAQRLSTIINADHIVVLEDGEIIEQGTHNHLMRLRGAYYQMHKNQTELSDIQ